MVSSWYKRNPLLLILVLIVYIITLSFTVKSIWRNKPTERNLVGIVIDPKSKTNQDQDEGNKKKDERTDQCPCLKATATSLCNCDKQASNIEKQACTANTTEIKVNKSPVNTRYLTKYPFMHDCKHEYNKIKPSEITHQEEFEMKILPYNFMTPPPNVTLKLPITRAVLVYFPIESFNHFESEFRWLYRSWINMQTYEPTKWRTDLIVFVNTKIGDHFTKPDFLFNKINCTLRNKRTNTKQKPMCTVIHYVAVKERKNTYINDKNPILQERKIVGHFINYVDIFNIDEIDMGLYLSYLKAHLANYGYLDSILMAFEDYDYFKSAGYDFLIRSDMDVFLTPGLAAWLPRYCNDFIVGGGAYSNTFNRKRLYRISKDMNLKYAHQSNLGSTWIASPEQFRIVSYLILVCMAYLASEEFTEPERKGKVGTIK